MTTTLLHPPASITTLPAPQAEPVALAFTPKWAKLVARRQEIAEAVRNLTAQKDALDAEIRGHLHAHNAIAGTVKGFTVVELAHTVRRTIDVKALREKDPELAERFTRATETQTLKYRK